MRILITGVTGFAGSHLAEALVQSSTAELFGISRRGIWSEELTHLQQRVELYSVDLCNQEKVVQLLRDICPEQIYHLAGLADVAKSFDQPQAAWRENFQATHCLLEAISQWHHSARIVCVSSGLIYGKPRRGQQCFAEDSPLYPAHPYAASKAAADLLSYQYSCHPGLEIIRVRPFNHIGPRQSEQFAVAHFAKQISAIEQGQLAKVIRTGNLEASRDVTDVRDIVQAYILLMKLGETGEAYNIASEQIYSMKEILNFLVRLAGIEVSIETEASLTRSVEPTITRVNAAKIRHTTAWRPTISLEQSLTDILGYWRQKTAGS